MGSMGVKVDFFSPGFGKQGAFLYESLTLQLSKGVKKSYYRSKEERLPRASRITF